MDIELFKEGLKSILRITKEAPILIEVKSGRMMIASHNNFHSVIFEMQTDMEDFKIVIPEKLARQLPQQIKNRFDLRIDPDEEKAVLFSDGVKLDLSILSPEAMSLNRLAKHYEKESVWTLNGLQFKTALDRIMHSANDKTIGDIVLRGYHMSIADGEVEMMASNGAAMSVTKFPVNEGDLDYMFLLNQDFFTAAKLLHDDEILVSYNDNAITLQAIGENSTLRIISSLTKGDAFKYHKVMEQVLEPKQNNESKTCVLHTKELKETLKKMNFFFDDSSKYRIEMEITPDSVVFSSSNMYGSTKNQVSLISTTVEEPMTIYLSGTNLYSYLNSIKSEQVEMSVLGSKSPVLFIDDLGLEILTVFNV